MLDPKVSVIVPVYNGANYVGQALESILGQTYPNIEIIVVNDGSTDQDATRRIVLAYGNKIRYIEKENGGVASALNCGIREMTGEYFAWLSHDDLFCKNKIAEQMNMIRASGNPCTIALGNSIYFSEGCSCTTPTAFQKYYDLDVLTYGVFLLFWGELHFSSLLIHKEHICRTGLFSEELLTVQDGDFIFKLLRGQTSVFVKNPVSEVRFHPQSVTNRRHDLLDKESKKLYLSLIEQLSPSEMEGMAGSQRIFLCKVAGIVKGFGGGKELAVIEKRLRRAPEKMATTKQTTLVRNKWEDMVIFGAGQFGIRLKYELNARGIYPRYFIDNDREKAGKQIDGIDCYPVEHIKEDGDPLIVIAQKFSAPAYQQLKDLGIKHIAFKDQVDADLLKIEPDHV